MSFSDRAAQLTEWLAEENIDAALLTSLHDVRWLTGFTGSSGNAVVTGDQVTFITDFRYTEQAAAEVPSEFQTVIADGPLRKEVLKAAEGCSSLAFDPSQLTALELAELEGEAGSSIEIHAHKELVTAFRAVKDGAELAAIAAAAELADDAFVAVVEAGLVGRTEADIAWALEVKAREFGAEGMSFPPIVASGPHGALPHATPRDVEVEPDQLVVIDWGVQLDGYCSDCTRTVATGDPGSKARDVHATVDKARIEGLEAVRPGPTGAEVDAVARTLISEAGFGEFFGHGLGHGVGLEIHEAPGLGKTGKMPLREGMVVTIEPGIYLPGEFGVRIEDLAVVTADGCRLLTNLQRELQIVG